MEKIPQKTLRNSTNAQVAHAWACGVPAENHRGSFWTDGRDLYSYRLRIGYRNACGDRVVICYQGKNFVSQTTASHVGRALRWADADTDPDSAARFAQAGVR